MRDAVVDRQKHLSARTRASAVQMAIDTGELAPQTDPGQFVFDMLAIILMRSRSEFLLGAAQAGQRARTSFDTLLRAHQNPR